MTKGLVTSTALCVKQPKQGMINPNVLTAVTCTVKCNSFHEEMGSSIGAGWRGPSFGFTVG